jgi:hypothetical protein
VNRRGIKSGGRELGAGCRKKIVFGLFLPPTPYTLHPGLIARLASGAFSEAINKDDLVKSPKIPFSVIPSENGNPVFSITWLVLDSRLRGNEDFLRDHQ